MTLVREVIYRTGQFWADIFPSQLSGGAWKEIEGQLTAVEQSLFNQYAPADKMHVYAVFRTLKVAGHQNPHLLTAALLHDVGKARYTLSVWDRVWPVLLKKIAPSLYEKWGDEEPTGWKRPFVIIKQHPEWGAKMAEEAGSHEIVVSLIRRHQVKLNETRSEEDHLLSLLQWADDKN